MLHRVDSLLVHPSISKLTACPGDTRISTQSSRVLVEETDVVERKKTLLLSPHPLSLLPKKKRKLDFRNFQIWRVNFWSEVSSCASRSIEAMVWINEIETAKSIAYLKTSYTPDLLVVIRFSCLKISSSSLLTTFWTWTSC